MKLWLPTRPYSLIDAINRMAAATGSVRYAMATSHVSYNGHRNSVYYNDYRGYHLCEHYWGERVVHMRGSYADCLRAGKREYDMGHLGTSVHAFSPKATAEDLALATELGYVPWSKEIEAEYDKTWQDARWDKLSEAASFERHGLFPAIGYLANSATVEEYEAKLEADRQRRRPR